MKTIIIEKLEKETWIHDLSADELAVELKRLEKELNPHQTISIYRKYHKPTDTISYSILYFITEEKNSTL